MNFFRFRILSLSLVSLVATAAYAVDQLPEKEEDIPIEIIPRHDYTLSIGLHRLSSGPKVKFGNLGAIQPHFTVGTGTNGVPILNYSTGSVNIDTKSPFETKSDGSQLLAGETLSTPAWVAKAATVNGRTVVTVYQQVPLVKTTTDPVTGAITPVKNSDGTYVPLTNTIRNPDGTVSDSQAQGYASTSQFLGFKADQVRTWSVQNASTQIDQNKHTVSMDMYGASGLAAGGTIDVDSSGSSGFELSLDRKLGQRGKLEWGFSGGFKLVDLNAKFFKTISSNLVKASDVYKMVDPTGANFKDSSGNPITTTVTGTQPSGTTLTLLDLNNHPVYSLDSTKALVTSIANGDTSLSTPLYLPSSTEDPNSPVRTAAQIIGVAQVHGYWQLKGAYYLAHLGPNFRYRFNDRWAVSGNLGVAVAYVGTTFTADESFDDVNDVFNFDGTPMTALAKDVNNPVTYASKEQNTTHKVVPGLYGEVNVEYWMTERTGFYFGVSAQSMRSFKQIPLSGRTANVELGTTSGWRVGIITRF